MSDWRYDFDEPPKHLDSLPVGAMTTGIIDWIRDNARLPYKKTPIPWKLRAAVLIRDHGVCQECGYTSPHGWSGSEMHADHIIPERHGGEATMENLQTLCRWCNSRKGSKLP